MAETYKIFPFCPGITWQLLYHKFIIPKLSYEVWKNLIENTEAFTVACYGGLLESVLSMGVFEMLKRHTFVPLAWAGNAKYLHLVKAQGIAEEHTFTDISKKKVKKFPTPLFKDRAGRIYFNYLNNYLQVYKWDQTFNYRSNFAITKQLTDNGIAKWNPAYFPKFNGLDSSWIKAQGLYNERIILILPKKTYHSNHNISMLSFSPMKINSLAALLYNQGFKIVIMSDEPNRYYSVLTKSLLFNLEQVLTLLPLAHTVMAKEIDYLILAMGGKAKIIGKKQTHEYRLENNAKKLMVNNKIYTTDDFKPAEVAKFIMGKK